MAAGKGDVSSKAWACDNVHHRLTLMLMSKVRLSARPRLVLAVMVAPSADLPHHMQHCRFSYSLILTWAVHCFAPLVVLQEQTAKMKKFRGVLSRSKSALLPSRAVEGGDCLLTQEQAMMLVAVCRARVRTHRWSTRRKQMLHRELYVSSCHYQLRGYSDKSHSDNSAKHRATTA